MTTAYLNRVVSAVPEHDVHGVFLEFANSLLAGEREHALFRRMVERCGIEHRWSTLQPAPSGSNMGPEKDGFYRPGAFPSTAARMRVYEREAPRLVQRALDKLAAAGDARAVTHVIGVTCTGFMAPGLDRAIAQHLDLPDTVERTMVGFMGCAAAINALKLARHIVRSEPDSVVLIVAVELCTLHLQEQPDLEQLLSFLIFGDGCAAALVSGAPHGLAIEGFRSVVVPETAPLINWSVGDQGFDMVLSGKVPGAIREGLRTGARDILDGASGEDVAFWAVHPGGRSVLDAVEAGLALPAAALAASRSVLRDFGNMSSATVLFVLERMLAAEPATGGLGCALAFGPGLVAESMLFRIVA